MNRKLPIKKGRITEFFVKVSESDYLFYLLLALNILLLCSTRFFPTTDGPSHVYNAAIIKELVCGNELFGQYYEFNHFFTPNWGTHFLLSILHLFFSSWMVEKIYFIFYIVGMALSFRFLIMQINPSAKSLSVFIFPAIYTYLSFMGFFNFSFSFILLFFILGLWIKLYPTLKYRHYVLFSFLLLYTYYTNLVTLFFLGTSMGLYSLYYAWINRQIKGINFLLKDLAKRWGLLFISSLPALTCFFLFYRYVQFETVPGEIEHLKLFRWLNIGRPLISYNFESEVYTASIVNLLIMILAVSLVKTDKNRALIRPADIMAIPLFIAVFLLFTTHPDANSGMMDIRYCTIVLMISLIWIIGRAQNVRLNTLFVFVVIFLHIKLLFYNHETIKIQNDKAMSVYQSTGHMEENCLVLPVSLDLEWVDGHIDNYAGYKKSVVVLTNYEADLKWFPLRRKNKGFSEYALTKPYMHAVNNFVTGRLPGDYSHKYILLVGNNRLLEETKYAELREALLRSSTCIFTSDDRYATLFKINQGSRN